MNSGFPEYQELPVPPQPVFPSVVRTVVPIVVSQLVTWLALVGVTGLDTYLAVIVGVVLTAVYYWAVRVLEQTHPAVGRWLLALGLTKATNPTYAEPPADR